MEKRLVLALLAASVLAAPAQAVDCSTRKFAGLDFTVCRVDLTRESLRLYHADARGVKYGSFARLDAELARENKRLAFAMNAGMFHPDRSPVGLLVIDGKVMAPLDRQKGFGNFFAKPNGVFLIYRAGPLVVATDDYQDFAPSIATQSGPLLLQRGQIPDNPVFQSKSRHLRNGVCVPSGATVAFVISERDMTFSEFATLFRDALGCTEALYLDGTISSLYAPSLKRADARTEMGPIFAVVE